MAQPTITVEIAFTSDPGATTPTWTNVTDYLRKFSTRRGRQRLLDQFQAGTCTLILDNTDRRFDPANTSSPYYPNVVPMRRIRIQATHNAVTYPIYEGFIDSWTPRWLKETAEAEVRATDAFKVLSLIDTTGPPWVMEMTTATPTGFWRLSESDNTEPMTDSSGSNHSGTYVGGPTMSQPDPITDNEDGAVLLDGVDDYLQLPASVSPVGTTAFTYAIWAKYTTTSVRQLLNWNNQILIELNSGGGDVLARVNGLSTTYTGPENWADGNWHWFVLKRLASDTKRYQLYVDNLLVIDATAAATTSYTASVPTYIGHDPGTSSGFVTFLPATVDEPAVWTRELSTGEINSIYGARDAWGGELTEIRMVRLLDYAGWPDNKRQIDNSTEGMVAQSDAVNILEHARQTAVAEMGSVYIERDGDVRFRGRQTSPGASQATFGDDTGELPFSEPQFEYSEQEIRNEVITQGRDTSAFVSSSSTSITKYLRRVFSLTGILNDNPPSIRDMGIWIRSHYEEPTLQITNITLQPWRENLDALWVQVLGRELEDMVTVKARPPGGGNVLDQLVSIQGISHDVSPQEWITKLDLSATNLRDGWLLGVAGSTELGVTTRLGW